MEQWERFYVDSPGACMKEPPVLESYAASARGSAGRELEIDPVCGTCRPQAPPSVSLGTFGVAPPIRAGHYIAHRAFSGDRWYLWPVDKPVADEDTVHEIFGGAGLGLAASPIFLGTALGVLTEPRLVNLYPMAPRFEDTPVAVRLHSDACPHAASTPLWSKHPEGPELERTSFVAACAHGLEQVCLNDPLPRIGEARSRICQTWDADPAGFWSPVVMRGDDGESAVITAHISGRVWVAVFNHKLECVGQHTLDAPADQLASQVLRPPAISNGEIWFFSSKAKLLWVSRVSSLKTLLRLSAIPANEESFKFKNSNGWFGCAAPSRPQELAWCPYQMSWNTGGRQLCERLLIPSTRLCLLLGPGEPHTLSYGVSLSVEPSLTAVRSGRLYMIDKVTCTSSVLNTNATQERALSSPADVRVDRLLGGPVWLNDSHVALPTMDGLVRC